MTELVPFGRDIWMADGPNVRDMGLLFTTRMTLVRLSNGSIWIESPVSLPPEVIAQVEELGPVRYLVAATQRHLWRLSGWHELFPQAELWAPASAPLTLGDSPGAVHEVFTDTPPPDWAADLEQLAFKGSTLLRETIFLHKRSQTAIMGDLIQANPMIRGRPFRNALFKVMGAAYPRGGVGLDLRMSFRDRDLARQSLERLLSWDFDRLIIAHGACIESEAKAFVREAFRWLAR